MIVHHLGYAVENLEKSGALLQKWGYSMNSTVISDGARRVDIQFWEKDGYLLELISPREEGSPVDGILAKLGSSPYHICYEVDDLGTAIAVLQSERFLLTEKPQAALAFEGRRVAFLYAKHMGVVELLEREKVVEDDA